MQTTVSRNKIRFLPDSSRVIARFLYTTDERAIGIIRSVVGLTENEARLSLSRVMRDYSLRHRNVNAIFERHFSNIAHLFAQIKTNPDSLDYNRKLLIGAYFTMEYAVDSAALFNPSIVEHPDQSGINPGEKRVIVSLRATGEGHISSIVFRTGILDINSNLTIEPVGKMLEEAQNIQRHFYNKKSFTVKLKEMDFHSIMPPELILDKLSDTFTYEDLRKCVEEVRGGLHLAADKEILINQIMWLASSHYEIQFH